MVLHVVLAASRQGRASAVLTPNATGPVAAECGVEDDVIFLEMLVDLATRPARETGGGGTPSGRVRVRAEGVAGETVVAGKIPDVDYGAGPFHRVDTSAGVVHARAVIIALGRFDGATETSLTIVASQATATARVHGHLILVPRVDTLDDVDLPAIGPIRPCHPESGPGATDTGGHVGEIEND